METNVSSRLPALLILLSSMVASVLCYLPVLDGPFFFDDAIHIRDNTQIHITDLSPASLAQAWSASPEPPPSNRPLAQLSFGLNHAFTGLSTWPFKATNLALHLLNGVLVFLLALTLLGSQRAKGQEAEAETNHWLFASLVASWWLLHPLNVTPVVYVVQRMTELSAIFVLAGILLYARGRLAVARGHSGLPAMILAFPVAALGFLAKENAIVFPLLILSVELTLFRALPLMTQRLGFRVFWSMLLLLGISASLHYLWNHLSIFDYSARPFTLPERLLTEARVLWLYVKMVLIPDIASFGFFHDDIAISRGWLQPMTTLPAVLAWLVALFAAVVLVRRAPWVSFGILFFLAGHALESSVVPLELVFEHRNYLPMLGILLALGGAMAGLNQQSRFRRLLPYLGGLLLLLFSAVTFQRVPAWQTEATLVVNELEHHPTSPRANFRAAQFYIGLLGRTANQAEAYSAARQHLLNVLESIPDHPNALFGLLVLDLHVDRPPEPWVIDKLERALREGAVGPTRLTISQFSFLVRWTMAGTSTLSNQDLLRLFEAALANPRLSVMAQSAVYSARRAFFDLVLHDPERAIGDARMAVKTWPYRWHYRKRLAELALRLSLFDESEKVLHKALNTDLADNLRAEAEALLSKVQAAREQQPEKTTPNE